MNGAATHIIKQDKEIIIMAFEFAKKTIEQKIILVDGGNKFVRYL
jgi:aspartate 1-decarboxylase